MAEPTGGGKTLEELKVELANAEDTYTKNIDNFEKCKQQIASLRESGASEDDIKASEDYKNLKKSFLEVSKSKETYESLQKETKTLQDKALEDAIKSADEETFEQNMKNAKKGSFKKKFSWAWRKFARVFGWVLLGLMVFAPMMAGMVIGGITNTIGLFLGSLSSGVATTLALFGVYKYFDYQDKKKAGKVKKWGDVKKEYDEQKAKETKLQDDHEKAVNKMRTEESNKTKLEKDIENAKRKIKSKSNSQVDLANNLKALFYDKKYMSDASYTKWLNNEDVGGKGWLNYFRDKIIELYVLNRLDDVEKQNLITEAKSVIEERKVLTADMSCRE